MRFQESRGFTLIELMIVVVVIGILASIAIPNYIALERRAQEGAVKSNMHTVQVTLEDFSIQNDGSYPTSGSDALIDGRTLAQVCPGRRYPINPVTKVPTVVLFNSNPTAGHPGELAINPANAGDYLLKGNGPLGDSLSLVLSTGQ